LGATNTDEIVNFETEKSLVGAASTEDIGHISEL
jgi:hypothetical protein